MTDAVRQCGSSLGVEVPAEIASAELRAAVALPTQGARQPPRSSLKCFDAEKEASSAVNNANGEVQQERAGAGEAHAPIDAKKGPKKKEGEVSDENREGQDDASKRKCSGAEAKSKSAPGEVEKAGQPASGAAAGEKVEPRRGGLSEEQRQQMQERAPPMLSEELRELERQLEEQLQRERLKLQAFEQRMQAVLEQEEERSVIEMMERQDVLEEMAQERQVIVLASAWW